MSKKAGEEKHAVGVNRRRFLVATGVAVATSALAGHAVMAEMGKTEQVVSAAPALPWPWKKLDPMEAGRRAYSYYHEKGG